jgi:hypothetical protein
LEKVILESIKDNGIRRDYQVFGDLVIHIGRGYDNDFIVADPHASAHHCTIRVHEQGFIIEDLSSTNGTMLNGKQKLQGQATALNSGDEIAIGRTRLRFMLSHHPVEPAVPMGDPSAFFSEINRPVKAWLIVFAALVLCELVEHQESFKNLAVQKFVSIGIGMVLIVLVWAGLWAFIGRLIKHKSSFNAQLSWTALFFLAMTIFYPLADHLGYITNSAVVEMVTGTVIFGIFLALLVAGHLTIATFISRRNQIIASSVVSIVILTFGIVTYYASKADFDPQPDYYATLLPPYAKLAPSLSMDEFIKKSQKVFLTKSNDTGEKH